MALSLQHADTHEEWRFPRPSFKVRRRAPGVQRARRRRCGAVLPGAALTCPLRPPLAPRPTLSRPAVTAVPAAPQVVILYVDEEESVRRQMGRAQLAAMHNKRVMDAGTGNVWDVRTTDINEALCRRRYQVGRGWWAGGRGEAWQAAPRCHAALHAAARPLSILSQLQPPLLPRASPRDARQVFKAHYHTILRLKSFFPFSLIDAMGTLEEARQQIMRELRYQSSLDLDEATYAAIRCARVLCSAAAAQQGSGVEGGDGAAPVVVVSRCAGIAPTA